MLNDDNIFTINASIDHSELEKIYKKIVKNINKIKTIEIKQDDDIQSSALLSILVSVKSSNPNIKIPLIDEQNSFLKGLGRFSIV